MGMDANRLKDLLGTLSTSDRYAVLMRYADGLSDWEIASVLDRPVIDIIRALSAFRDHAEQALQAQTADSASYRV